MLEKDGFYCWVKYDPSKDKLTYTVTTTNGKLNIDYALLENVVYYLQEAIAPDGYDTDPEIYVICDEESYKELEGTEVTNPATGATSKVTESSWLGSILGGITRDSIIKIARDLGYTVEEQLFTRDEVYYADEAFFSGTAAELTPIRELDNRTIGEGHAGPVTKALQAAYFKAIKGQDPRYGHWLTNYKF